MPMTMTQKILAHAAGLNNVEAGQLIEAKLDLVLGNDITAPVAIREFEKTGCKAVFDQKRVAFLSIGDRVGKHSLKSSLWSLDSHHFFRDVNSDRGRHCDGGLSNS